MTTPVVLMLLLVWLRTEFTPEKIDSQNLLELSHPLYTLKLNNDDGKIDTLATTQGLESFFTYNNYTDIFGVGYDVLYDY